MPEDKPSPDQQTELKDRLEYIESVLRDAVARLYQVEMRMGIVRPPSPGLPDPTDKPPAAEKHEPPQPFTRETPRLPTRPPSPPLTTERQALPGVRGESAQTVGSTPRQTVAEWQQVPKPQPRAEGRGDLELRIGGSWFNRIGVVAICFGVAFFLKLAYDNQWIGHGGLVLLVAAIGVSFVIGGELLRARYRNYAFGLSGGGILILYMSIYAAFNLYQLIAQPVAFAFMALVTATAALLSARSSALPIAILGLIGGFLTPILLSTGTDNEVALFGYIALLDAGVLALAYGKQWRSLNYLAFGSTVAMVAGWMEAWYEPEKLEPTIVFLTLFFAIFALLAVLYNVVNRRPTKWLDLILVFSNALLYFATSYKLLDEGHHSRLGLFAIFMSAFYFGLGYFTWRRDREDRLLVLTFMGLAFLFVVIAVPIQLDQDWVTMAWAVEGAVMTWIGLKVKDRISRYAALGVFAIAVIHWFNVDVRDFAYVAWNTGATFLPVLNRRGLSCGVLVASLAASASFYKRRGAEISEGDRAAMGGLLMLAANALSVTLLSLDAGDYFEQMKPASDDATGGAAGLERLSHMKQFTFSALWTIYGASALVIGIRRRITPLRWAALALLAVATLKVMVLDLAYSDAPWHALFMNDSFAAFGLLVIALAVGARAYSKAEGAGEDERMVVPRVMAGAANVLAVIALSSEAIGYFNRARGLALAGGGDTLELSVLDNWQWLALSAVWTVYGAVALIIGIRRGVTPLRWGALGLLALAAVKVVAIDLRYYDAEWHRPLVNQTFAAFALLVGALSAAVWFYTRAERVDEWERRWVSGVIVCVANVLAIIALSAEATGYYAARMHAATGLAEGRFDLGLAQRLSLSLVWTLYGGAMLAIGLSRRSGLLRVMGMLLLGVTILKVFILDLASLEKVYRVISLIVLGVILLAVSFLYQRYRRRAALSGDEQTEVEPGVSGRSG
ncbi:MAG TPA: DUF2339 domain-containing protein [Blastocatellia bacterium]|nr:DUF2339 domain-containing protein [Blastocatellia bacterium]